MVAIVSNTVRLNITASQGSLLYLTTYRLFYFPSDVLACISPNQNPILQISFSHFKLVYVSFYYLSKSPLIAKNVFGHHVSG